MKHTLALVLMVFGLVGCASTMNPSSPRAQALMQEIRADRLAAERIERAELAANRKNTPEKEEDINELLDRINETKLGIEVIQEIQEKTKQKILTVLKQRCVEYGFTGESNISACIQREAQHDKELAVQRQELGKARIALQQAQANTYAQNVTEPVPEEEDLPFLIKFLGDVAMGVAENLADPAFQRDMQQQRQINELKANQNRDIYRDCRPNC